MTKIIAFPHLDKYYIPIKYIVENITKCRVIIPPENNKETINIGSMYSPNDICVPFKYNLGNYIDALNQGANVLIQAGGGCRYGYYGPLQEEILKQLGYPFTFINLIKDNHVSITKLYKEAKKLNSKLNIFTYIHYLFKGILIIIFMDKLNKYKREHQALAVNPEFFNINYKKILNAYSKSKISLKDIIKIYYKYKKQYKEIPLKENEDNLKILIIGELYTLMDSEANNHLEDNLIDNDCIVYRYTDLTYLLLKKRFMKHKMLLKSKKYLKYALGADGEKSVYHALEHCKKGIDGIIHIKSYGCVPEINAIPILNQISNDYHVPILYLSYDGQNNIANIDTKLEAFNDMLKAKKQTKNKF